MRNHNPIKVFLITLLLLTLLSGCGALEERLAAGTAVASGKDPGGMFSGEDGAQSAGEDGEGDELTAEEMETALAQTLEAATTRTPQTSPTVTPEPDEEALATPTPTATEEGAPTPTVPGYQFTALAQTLTSMVTTPGAGELTETPEPTIEGGGVATGGTPTATATLEPIAENPCNSFRFVFHLNYPPGSIVQPNTYFYKGWYVQNNGDCAWNAGYSLVLYDGFQLGGTNPLTLGGVAPGQFAEIWQTFYTPPQPGTYYSYWLIRDANGNLFGGGENGDEPLVVQIVVPGVYTPTYPGPITTAPPFTPGP
jgi:hypothetical protein